MIIRSLLSSSKSSSLNELMQASWEQAACDLPKQNPLMREIDLIALTALSSISSFYELIKMSAASITFLANCVRGFNTGSDLDRQKVYYHAARAKSYAADALSTPIYGCIDPEGLIKLHQKRFNIQNPNKAKCILDFVKRHKGFMIGAMALIVTAGIVIASSQSLVTETKPGENVLNKIVDKAFTGKIADLKSKTGDAEPPSLTEGKGPLQNKKNDLNPADDNLLSYQLAVFQKAREPSQIKEPPKKQTYPLKTEAPGRSILEVGKSVFVESLKWSKATLPPFSLSILTVVPLGYLFYRFDRKFCHLKITSQHDPSSYRIETKNRDYQSYLSVFCGTIALSCHFFGLHLLQSAYSANCQNLQGFEKLNCEFYIFNNESFSQFLWGISGIMLTTSLVVKPVIKRMNQTEIDQHKLLPKPDIKR